jgi:hypothetical protein
MLEIRCLGHDRQLQVAIGAQAATARLRRRRRADVCKSEPPAPRRLAELGRLAPQHSVRREHGPQRLTESLIKEIPTALGSWAAPATVKPLGRTAHLHHDTSAAARTSASPNPGLQPEWLPCGRIPTSAASRTAPLACSAKLRALSNASYVH